MKIKDRRIDIARLLVSLTSLICFAAYIVYLIITFGLRPNMPQIIGGLTIGGVPILLSTVFSVISLKHKSRFYPVIIILSFLAIALIDLIWDTNFGLYNIRIFNEFVEWHYDWDMVITLIYFALFALAILIYKKWLLIISSSVFSFVSILSLFVCYIDGYRFFSIYILTLSSLLLAISIGLFSNNIYEENDITNMLDKNYDIDEAEDDCDFVQSVLAVQALFYPSEENVNAIVFYDGMKNKNWSSIKHLFNEEYALKFAKITNELLKDYFSENKINEIHEDCLRVQYALENFILNGKSDHIIHDLFRVINYKTDFRETIDIKFNSAYSELSNFTSHPFELDGIYIESIEGFLQGLKFKSIKKQHKLFAMSEHKSKKAGQHNFYWNYCFRLYYNGKKIDRFSNEYNELITSAFDAMAEQNPSFREVLISTEKAKLIHSVGKKDKYDTVLTQEEFVAQLNRLRNEFISIGDLYE